MSDRSKNINNSSREAARHQFDRQATEYAASIPHATSESLTIMSRWASERRYSIGLDIATGPGFTAFAMAPFCGIMIASDIAPKMLEQAREIALSRGISNVRFEIIDAHALTFEDCSMDLVTSRTAPHHFRDVPLFLSEVQRVLKPGGAFILADTSTSENETLARWHQKVEALRDPTHIAALSPSRWMRVMQQSGLAVKRSADARVDMQFQDWVERSGTGTETVAKLFDEFSDVDPAVASEYRIKPIGDGSDFAFSWPVFVCQAEKSSS